MPTRFLPLSILLLVVIMVSQTEPFQGSPLRPAFVRKTDVKEADLLRELVHYATLAPSSHNTQCWKFQIDDKKCQVTVLPDMERACPVVDPDDHHLYVSLGCAIENLVIAANAHGYDAAVDTCNPGNGIPIQLTPNMDNTQQKASDEMFEAIPERQMHRCEYDGKSLSQDELHKLQQAGTGNGVRVILVTDHAKKETILEHICQANTLQLSDNHFKKALASWIRFNEKDAAASGDGLYSNTVGSPAVPTLLGKLIFKAVVRPSSENAKVAKQVRSSAGIAIFVSGNKNDPVHWVEVGRCYERFALKSNIMGIRNAMLNMPIEEPQERQKFSTLLGLTELERPDLVVRFGRGGVEMPKSPRRPIETVIVYNEK